MPRKLNVEQTIIDYFETANIDKAEVVLSLAAMKVKARRKSQETNGSLSTAIPVKVRRKRSEPVEINTVTNQAPPDLPFSL